MGMDDQEGEGDGESCNLSCLVAVGRVQPPVCSVPPINYMNAPNHRNIHFISRHAMDGKFIFVDQRSTLVLGFLPQELLGTSMYEYFHPDDIPTLAETHKVSLLSSSIVKTPLYRLRAKDGSYISLQSEWKSFRNPWTKDVEYLIAKNSVVPTQLSHYNNEMNNQTSASFDFFNQSNGRDMQRFINTHVESSKIGSQIAEEVLEAQRRGDSPSENTPDTTNVDVPLFRNNNIVSERPSSSNVSAMDHSGSMSGEQVSRDMNGTLPNFSQIYTSPSIAISSENVSGVEEDMMEIIGKSPSQEPPPPVNNTDGNDEAAMAVIMSLLEADAGLGGPVDFSGLPWPLP